jgi:hypothetical protein
LSSTYSTLMVHDQKLQGEAIEDFFLPTSSGSGGYDLR